MDRKMDISIEWSQYILGYKYVAMLQLSFEALVLFSFSISSILFCSRVKMSFVPTFVEVC